MAIQSSGFQATSILKNKRESSAMRKRERGGEGDVNLDEVKQRGSCIKEDRQRWWSGYCWWPMVDGVCGPHRCQRWRAREVVGEGVHGFTVQRVAPASGP